MCLQWLKHVLIKKHVRANARGIAQGDDWHPFEMAKKSIAAMRLPH